MFSLRPYFFMFHTFFNQILTLILYIINVSRTVLAGIGLAWPVGDRPMRDPRMAHLKSCAPRIVQRSTVYWIIVHVLDWFKYQHNLLINGLLTVKAGWGVYCFVVVRGGGDAGSGAPDGGPDPRPQPCRKNKENLFDGLLTTQSNIFFSKICVSQ
jgi:hypothetical protein